MGLDGRWARLCFIHGSPEVDSMLILRTLVSILILPGTALVLVPAWLLSGGESAETAMGVWRASDPLFWTALLLLTAGLSLLAWTVSLFFRRGRGTLAPWDPPEHLVITGPYRYVRNPMITGVVTALAGEALLFQSVSLGTWCLVFFAVSAVHFPLVEEPGLRRRFGDDYSQYCANVPRWFPRLKPWSPDDHRPE